MVFGEKVEGSTVTADDPNRWDNFPIGMSPFPLGVTIMVTRALEALDRADQNQPPDPPTPNTIGKLTLALEY